MIDFPSSPILDQEFETGSYTYKWDGVAWISVPGGSGGVPEAPADGVQYGRQDTAWTPVDNGGLPDAPSDTLLYGRQDASWMPVVIPAPPTAATFAADFVNVTGDTITGDLITVGTISGGGSIHGNANQAFIANTYVDWGASTLGINVLTSNPSWGNMFLQSLHVQGAWAGWRLTGEPVGSGSIDFSISGASLIDTHGGTVNAATFNGNLNGNASSASTATNVQGYVPSWSDPGGIPAYLWGSDVPNSTMYLVPPSRLSVNYANSAGSAPANGGTASNVSSIEGAGGGTIHGNSTINGTLTTNAAGVGLSCQGYSSNAAINFNNFVEVNPTYGFTLSAQHQSGVFAGLSFQLGGTEMFRFRSDGWGSAAANWNSFSDRTLKDDLIVIDDAITRLKMLTGYTYTRNDIPVAPWSPADKRYVGLLGQDAQVALPESTNIDENGLILLDYAAITTLLVNAVKEINTKFEAYVAAHP
jgi:hypothetical protein